MGEFVFVKQLPVVVQLVSHDKRFEERSPEIYRYSGFPVDLYFFFEVWRDEGTTKAELQQVDVRSATLDEVFRLADSEPFIHHHSQSVITRLWRPLGNVLQREVH